MQKQGLKGIITSLCLCLCMFCHAQTETEQDIFEGMRQGEKAAVVAVHRGTTDNYAIRVCIGQFNEQVKKDFPQCDFREAWTSQNAISECAERGLMRQSLADVLEELASDGYTRVLLQSSEIVKGIELDFIQHEIDGVAERFRRIRLTPPLLTAQSDYEKVILAIAAEYGIEKSVNVLVCDDNNGEEASCFAMLEYVLHDKGYSNWFVVSLNGFPSAESLIRQLKRQKNKNINLIPFAFATSSANQDSYAELRKRLSSSGYKTTLIEHTLGEASSIRSLFSAKAKHSQQFRIYSPVEQKMMHNLK